MITGIGTDIVEISRIEGAISTPGFLQRYFSEEENLYFLRKNNRAETVAAAFAAKEAFSKALGTGICFALKEAEVLHTERGMPYFRLSGRAAELAHGLTLHLSVSHSKAYAVAFVTAERLEECAEE